MSSRHRMDTHLARSGGEKACVLVMLAGGCLVRKSTNMWKDETWRNLRDVGCENSRRVELAQDRIQWRPSA